MGVGGREKDKDKDEEKEKCIALRAVNWVAKILLRNTGTKG